MTIEDPIEYKIDGISQTQVNNKIDLSFAKENLGKANIIQMNINFFIKL